VANLLRRKGSILFLFIYLLSMPIYCLIRLADQPAWIGPSTALTAASLFAFSLAHAVARRGPGRAMTMLAISFVVALTLEYLGSSYGFLFGAYDYTDRLGPKLLGKVPAIIPIAWFMMLYPAWAIADYLLIRYAAWRGTALPAFPKAVARVVTAALAMTAWDLSLDPRMVADGNWAWQVEGAYFGIPLSNYLGWFVTAALIYIGWHAIVGPTEDGGEAGAALGFRNWPVWAYIVTWLGEGIANAIFWGGPLVALFVFSGMGLFGGPALFSLLRSARQMQHHPSERWSLPSRA